MANLTADVDIDFDVIDYIDELETSELIAELNHRGAIPEEQVKLDPKMLDGIKLRDFLASIVQVGSHVSNEEVLKLIKERL